MVGGTAMLGELEILFSSMGTSYTCGDRDEMGDGRDRSTSEVARSSPDFNSRGRVSKPRSHGDHNGHVDVTR